MLNKSSTGKISGHKLLSKTETRDKKNISLESMLVSSIILLSFIILLLSLALIA